MYKFKMFADKYYERGPLITTFTDAIEDAVYHYKAYNCRLANMICIFSMLIPRWLVNVLDGIVGCVFFLMLFKAARISLKRVNMPTAVVGALLFWLAFPWYDFMASSDFYMNYAWSSAFALVVVYFLRKSHELSKLQLGAVTFFAILAAWIHEAFGCALIAYTFFLWLLGTKIDKRSRLIIGLGLCLGLLVTILGATESRIGNTVTIDRLLCIQYRIPNYISETWPTYVAILMTIFLRKRIGKQRFAAYRAETVGSFVAIAVIYPISFVVCELDRVLWPAQLFATLQIIRCVNALTYKQNGYSKAAKIVFGCAAVLYAMWSCELLKWQKKFTDENTELIEAAQKVDKPVVYYDLTPTSEVPFYLLGIVFHEWNGDINPYLAYHVLGPGHKNILILPKKWEGVPIQDVKEPGSQHIKGAFPTFYTVNDTTEYRFNAILCEPMRAVTPIDRLLMLFTPDEMPEPFARTPLPPFIVDGQEVSVYNPPPIRRIVKYRKFVRIEE
jgi:hypothetical protein